MFQKKIITKCDLKVKNMGKTQSKKMNSQKVPYQLLPRSYEQFKFFSQTSKLTTDKNISEDEDLEKLKIMKNVVSFTKRSKKM